VPEDAAARLARLASAEGGNLGVKELLDAVVLAAAWAHSGQGEPGTADGVAEHQKPGQADITASTQPTRAVGDGPSTGVPHEPAASVWLADQGGSHTIRGKRVSVGRAPALPNALDIGRALRPLRRPWVSGTRRRLDVDATVEHYTRTGILVPQLASAPEAWLEVVVVLDRGTAMAVWDETVRTLTRTLRALGAFRDVRVWHLEHPPGEAPVLHDHYGRAVHLDQATGHTPQPPRRLLLIVTDCAAPAWRQDTVWRTLHAWGLTAPVALINPLPKRLWQRSGLDLPRTTATATVPASPGRLLSYRRPRLLRETPDTRPWQALPVLQFDPAQILAWARTLMRTDPTGCEAVLVPATGRPPLRRRLGLSNQPDPVPTDEQVRARAKAFTDDRDSPAVRLAITAAPLGSFTLPVLDVLRDHLVPDAALSDTAEFLTSGFLTATRSESADTIYEFHPEAAAHLTSLLTRDQLWAAHFALSDHLAARLQAPHGIPVVLHSSQADETLATGVRPIAHAAATTTRLLGVEATDPLPEARRRPAADLTAETSGKPKLGAVRTNPKMPDDSPHATGLYLTLARLFRSLLARASDSHAVHPSEPRQHEALKGAATGNRHSGQTSQGNDGARELPHLQHELVISIDVGGFHAYDDADQPRMRDRVYRVLDMAFSSAEVERETVHIEDRGDSVLVITRGQAVVKRLLGRWLVGVHQNLRYENSYLGIPLRLRIGMHIGSVQHHEPGVRGSAVTLACRLADSSLARRLLDTENADLVIVASQSLYENVISAGGRFIDPELYSPGQLKLKEGPVTAWFHLLGRPTPETRHTVVVVTTLPIEYDAVRIHLDDIHEHVLPDGTRIERGHLADTPLTLAIAELGEGGHTAAVLTQQIVNELRPEALLFVGIAGGLKDDIKIGDVVVGTKMYGIGGGRLTPEGFSHRPESWHGSHRLLQAARSALRDLGGVRAQLKPIVCWNMALPHDRSAVAAVIQRHSNDAYSIEMENSGALHAAHLSSQLDVLVIRGISDLVNPSKDSDETTRSPQYAAAQAASVAVAVLRKHWPLESGNAGSFHSEEGHLQFAVDMHGSVHVGLQSSTFYGPVIRQQTEEQP